MILYVIENLTFLKEDSDECEIREGFHSGWSW
jgi:hypothetical protein